MKVMTVVGTRPEVIKLSRVIPALDLHFDHVLVHTGQNYDYELDGILFDQMKIRAPDRRFHNRSLQPLYAMAQYMTDAEDALCEYEPDAVLILGDTNSAVAAAYAAKRRHIPIFHMEAGNRCFDDRVPEEVNRRIVDHISDINMPYTEHARRNLLAEGIAADRIIKTGSPMREVLGYHCLEISDSPVLEQLGVQPNEYFVVSAHREENVDNEARLYALWHTICALQLQYPVVVSLHPRTKQRLHTAGIVLPKAALVLPPFGFIDYMQLQHQARCVISDSGTLAEESAIQQFPAVTIRDAHERPEATDVGTMVRSNLLDANVLRAVAIAVRYSHWQPVSISDYAQTCVSRIVVNTIVSGVDYVKRRVYGV